jgi:hypothetical protein
VGNASARRHRTAGLFLASLRTRMFVATPFRAEDASPAYDAAASDCVACTVLCGLSACCHDVAQRGDHLRGIVSCYFREILPTDDGKRPAICDVIPRMARTPVGPFYPTKNASCRSSVDPLPISINKPKRRRDGPDHWSIWASRSVLSG